MVGTMTSKGQITIPNAVRKRLGLKPGDRIEFAVQDDGTAVMKPLARRAAELFGFLSSERKRDVVSVEDMNRLLAEAFHRGRR